MYFDWGFRQVDLAVLAPQIFVEIDGPEHESQKGKDTYRERQILGVHPDWRFRRILSRDAELADYAWTFAYSIGTAELERRISGH